MIRKATLVLAALVLCLQFTSCGSSESSDASQTKQPAAQVANQAALGSPANLVAFDPAGNQHQMSEWLGKQPLVINFWGTWCPPCRAELPDLMRLYKEYKPRGVEIVGIAIRDKPYQVSAFAEKAGLEWVMLMVDDKLRRGFKLAGSVPTTIFYDKDGNEKARFVGRRDYAAFKPAFEAIL